MLDIEELARLGEKLDTCPYYASRANVNSADLLVLPYNMLLIPEARKALGISLLGKVIVFDEAHNVIDSIRGAFHLRLTTAQVRF